MSEYFLGMVSEEDLEFDGFFDGQQKLIPEGTELEVVVLDGFNGIEEGNALMNCFVQVSVTTPGEFLGQKYKYNAKIYENDAAKRDKAFKNLTVLDTQAGSPLAKQRLPLTTENMQEHWVGASHARAKFGVFQMEPSERNPDPKPGNYIQGFGFLRDKLPQAAPVKSEETAPVNTAKTTTDDSDIGF